MRKDKFIKLLKAIFILIFAFFYMAAGVFHFLVPEKYYQIIPPYLSYPQTLNIIAGIFEIIFGFGLLIGRTRKDAAYGLILLLSIFFTVHIYMIQMAPMKLEGVEILPWMAWLRLIFQFVLIYIAWIFSTMRISLFRRW